MAIILDGLTGITTPGLTNTGTETIVNLTTTGNTILGDASTDTLNVGNGGLVKDASGNVGIGTASPGYKLDVQGGAASFIGSSGVNAIRVAGAGGSWFWIDNATGTTMRFSSGSTAGTNSMSFSSSGNLLFSAGNYQKTMADGVEATIFDSPVSSAWNPYMSYTPSTGTSSRGYKWGAWNNGGTQTEWMRLWDGNLLVGTTGANNNTSTFFKASGVNLPALTVFKNSSASSTDNAFCVGNGNAGFTNCFIVLANGNALNTNNSYGAISDARLKENVVDATPKLADLMQVKVRQYNLIADEEKQKQLGVIADELETVFPSMITEGNDGFKNVKYSVFVPMLIKAIQEQQALITTLTDRITALEGSTPA